MFTEVVSDRGDGPCVVYVPGIDGSGELLFSTASRLERRFRLVRLRYVRGVSKKNETYPHLAESLVESVGLRGVESMILLAESFGGGVALQAALDYPDRVRALVLVNTFPRFRRRTGLVFTRLGAKLLPRSVLSWGRDHVAPQVLFGKRKEDEAIRAFRETVASWRLDSAYRARLAMIARLDLRDRLGEVHQPTLLFAGTDDRVVDSVRQAREMGERLPNSTLETIDGGGHMILPLAEIDWVDYLAEADSAAMATPGGAA
ncbi:MAG: alpha/beta hydrolase [Acidobacteriota bacterium]|nr:alpha/beta hydrolase [Acidobacteriota bacterium]